MEKRGKVVQVWNMREIK